MGPDFLPFLTFFVTQTFLVTSLLDLFHDFPIQAFLALMHLIFFLNCCKVSANHPILYQKVRKYAAQLHERTSLKRHYGTITDSISFFVNRPMTPVYLHIEDWQCSIIDETIP